MESVSGSTKVENAWMKILVAVVAQMVDTQAEMAQMVNQMAAQTITIKIL